jgi:hypothetical protein
MNIKDSITNMFGKKKDYTMMSLEECVKAGILTKEEKLRIEKDRAINKWEEEIRKLRTKK